MEDIQIRKLVTSDLEQMLEIHSTREELDQEGAEKRTQLLEWLAFKNPFVSNGETTYFVAEDSGKIVAYQGRMPMEFAINGRPCKAYYAHDTYVHPEYRKKGFGFWLISELAKATEEQTDAFFCLYGMTPLNLKIQRRMGYFELPAAQLFVKILDPRAELVNTIKIKSLINFLNPIFRGVLWLIDFALLKTIFTKTKISEVKRFDSRFDEFNRKILSKIGLCSNKSSKYLNWKYIDRPYQREKVFAAEKNGEILGFVVLGLGRRDNTMTGIVVDIMADPDDKSTISLLCKATTQYFREKKVFTIRCVLSDEKFAKIFIKFLFIKRTGGKSVLLGNLEKGNENKEIMKEINNWHFTIGESDGFMLSP